MTTKPFGLDFGAIVAVGRAAGADMRMLSDVLSAVEAAAIAGPEGASIPQDEEEEADDDDA